MSLNQTVTPGYSFSASSAVTGVDELSPLYPHHQSATARKLIQTAHALVNPRGKGIYATDETIEGIAARLAAATSGEKKEWSVEEQRERRRDWRKCLYDTLPSNYISGVILYHETLHDFQLASILEERGIIPGIRADTDSHPLPISPLEPATQGLDDLLPRLQASYEAGARFSKWRAPFLVDATTFPTQAAIDVQAESLARFAATSQQAGLVPIVEPDVDFGADASLTRSVEAHVKIISAIYSRLAVYGVLIEGTLIKPSFPQPGLKYAKRKNVSVDDIAIATATVLVRTIPIGVAGVVFLSGGLEDETATDYLRALNKLVDSADVPNAVRRLPPLSFSFGRGLQGDAMKRWVRGDSQGAKDAFEHRASVCYAAAKGE
ncbi:aldolase [Ramaria rubella]|nr:aldolase [Ramaria rubella]